MQTAGNLFGKVDGILATAVARSLRYTAICRFALAFDSGFLIWTSCLMEQNHKFPSDALRKDAPQTIRDLCGVPIASRLVLFGYY